jgi:ABC-2 type transport system permease protein
VPTCASWPSVVGGPVALILGALSVGSEYGWGTMKTLATQGPGRGRLAVGRLAALSLAVAGLVVASFGTAFFASVVVAGLQGEPVAIPPAAEMLGGLGAAWLMLAVFAALGAALATVFRGSALAIGLGLVYFFVVESALPLQDRVLELVEPALLTPNVLALATAFGVSPVAPFGVFGVPPSTGQAAAVLGGYVIGFTAVSVWLSHRRAIA